VTSTTASAVGEVDEDFLTPIANATPSIEDDGITDAVAAATAAEMDVVAVASAPILDILAPTTIETSSVENAPTTVAPP
jgi:hypothetical protein